MARIQTVLALAGLLCAGAVAAWADPNDVLPEAPAKAVVVRACSSCHQPAVIVAKPHTGAEWDELVGKMIDRGAQLTDAEQDQVIAYLTKFFAPPPAVAPAPSGH